MFDLIAAVAAVAGGTFIRVLVTGTDGRVSTSKFQSFGWITAILAAYAAQWGLRASQGDFTPVSTVPAGVLTVLGLSTGTAVAAKAITSAYVRNGRVEKSDVRLLEGRAPGLFADDSGAPDLAKIQLVVITLIAIGIFLATVIHQMVTSPRVVGMPDIDTILVVLIAISQAGYLGRKLVTADGTAWPAGALRNLPAGRSWSLTGLAVAALVAAAVVVAAVFGRQGIERTTSNGHWGGVLTFALLCSLISFAVLEMGKRLLPVRQFVQERYLLQWWAERARATVVPMRESWTELTEAMDIGSPARSVFGLPIQLLAAQVSNAAELALAEPARHPLLYHALTRSAEETRALRDQFAPTTAGPASQAGDGQSGQAPDPGEAGQQAGGGEPGPAAAGGGEPGPAAAGGGESGPAAAGEQEDTELLAAMAAEWEQSRKPGAKAGDGPLLRTPARDTGDDSRSYQAGQRARGAIDSLQLAVGERWRRSVQAASVLLAALAGLLIQLAHPSETRWLYVMAAALVGGPLAWTIRDLAAAIERWRR